MAKSKVQKNKLREMSKKELVYYLNDLLQDHKKELAKHHKKFGKARKKAPKKKKR